MTQSATELCPQDALDLLANSLANGAGTPEIDEALSLYPGDPRLHFLRGSVLASEKRYDEARTAIGQAVTIAPDYAIARFQLGLLEFTSGEPDLAGLTWGPLEGLPQDHALRHFSEGLMRLPADDIEGAVARLRQGIAANDEHPILSRDMRMLIDTLLQAPNEPAPEPEPTSETDMLLRQLGPGTRH